MSSTFVRSFVLALSLLASHVAAETLPLPDNLTDLRSKQGEKFLLEADSYESYFAISTTFETQKNQAYCGIASIVMTLNATHIPAPASAGYEPFHIFTQDNLLDDRTEAILPQAILVRQGMTLDQLGQFLSLHPITVEVRHATDNGRDEFRKIASEYLATNGRFVIVNYLRKAIGQQIGGHISPLASYDAKTDRFLILDVARYKYPPVWVTASDLFDAMNTRDIANDNKTRGYVLISNKATDPTRP